MLNDLGKFPEITCAFYDTYLPALIDTGSHISIVSKKVYDRLMIKPELTTWKGSIVGATGNQLHALGRISLPLRIGSWIRTKVFAVVENFPYEVLLGINVLHRSDIRLSKYTFRPHQGQKVPLRPPDLPPETPV